LPLPMIFDVHVLGFTVLDRVFCKRNRSLIVAMDDGRISNKVFET